jgi:peptidyl-prolyl cis-trans isomerase-like 4
LADSQFCISLIENYEPDTELAIFGAVVEGLDTLDKINEIVTDFSGKPLLPVLVLHSHVLDDPFEEDDIDGVSYPDESPPPSPGQIELIAEAFNQEESKTGEDSNNDNANGSTSAVKTKSDRDATAQALTLEIIGDLPFAEVKPEENVLFVCKLNPVTQADDLELIFSRFGKILSCEVIRDPDTGESLQYAFIEFDRQEDCERAYLKMEGVLIDDRRIHVDFSQSVAKLAGAWRNKSNAKRRSVHGAQFQSSAGGGNRRSQHRSASPRQSSSYRKRDDDNKWSDRRHESSSRRDNDRYSSSSRRSDSDKYGRDKHSTASSNSSDRDRYRHSHREKDERSHRDRDSRSSRHYQDERSSRDRIREREREDDRAGRGRDRDRRSHRRGEDEGRHSHREHDRELSSNSHRRESSSRR